MREAGSPVIMPSKTVAVVIVLLSAVVASLSLLWLAGWILPYV
jgi:hypothetical protein